MSDGPIVLFSGEAIAAPGANTTFAAFTMVRRGAGVRVTIMLATSSVLNLRSDSTVDYDGGLNASVALTASDIHAFDVPSLAKYVPGSSSTLVSYGLRVETNGIIQLCTVTELLTSEF